MKKLFLNRKPVDGPWGGGNLFVKAVCAEAYKYGYEVFFELVPNLDVIFMHDPRPGNTNISVNEIAQYKSAFPKTKVVHRVNECDARKGTQGVDSLLRASSAIADDTVFVSSWM